MSEKQQAERYQSSARRKGTPHFSNLSPRSLPVPNGSGDSRRKATRLAFFGFGNVGRGLAELLLENKSMLRDHCGFEYLVVAVADSTGYAVDEAGLDLQLVLDRKTREKRVGEQSKQKEDNGWLIKDLDVDILVETTPTNAVNGEPGLSHLREALRSGKDVVSTNKGPFALAYSDVMKEAYSNERAVKFSGTVGGATPFIDFARKCLVPQKLLGVEGILNGTTNYILTRMHWDGTSFESALKEAQLMGIAEADPSYDVKGIDTACKLAILANSVMDQSVALSDVAVEGIDGLEQSKVDDAKRRGKAIKLIGSIGKEISVKPVEIPIGSPICVNETLNAVRFSTELVGDFYLIGKGAGGKETATAALRDILDIADMRRRP